MIIGQNGTLKTWMDQIPGIKFLVRGNHDHESDNWYMKNGFAFVGHGLLYGGVWFTHAPSKQLPDGAKINVHGHLHDSDHHGKNIPQHCKLLALEQTNYEPVEFESFLGFYPQRKVVCEGYF